MRKDSTTRTKSNPSRFACTTMIVGKKASADGSVIVAHSDDDVSDERLVYVPERPFKKSSMRNVYYDDASLGHNPDYNATELRRYIGKDRGPGYEPIPGEEFGDSIPLGAIPQYPENDPDYPIPLPKELKTYAYFDSNYGVMNEHQLMIGECTCGAKVHPGPEPNRRIFYAAELSRVALERCTQARDAVKLMGYLIKRYGYYGTGETLLVGDTHEAWVMEMCGYDLDGSDGIWVAQKVPDDHYFVAANEFRIRDVDRGQQDSESVMFSDNLFEVCEKRGWIKPGSTSLDWLPAVSYGEYSNPYYSLRRVWRAFMKAAPSLDLPAWVENGYTREYPFSAPPDSKLSVLDVVELYRDHYEGTEFDLTKGLAAGPFADPTRYERNPDQNADTFNLNIYHPDGAWERPLSIYRCGMMWVNQARDPEKYPDPIGGISWVGLDRPAANCLMPFYVGIVDLPSKMQNMLLTKFDRDQSAWWSFNFVANWATIKYSYMMKDIQKTQKSKEEEAREHLSNIDEQALALYRQGNLEACKKFLTDFCATNMEEVLRAWKTLSDTLIVKYNDGCITEGKEIMHQVGYPRSWLSYVGYFDGPISYKKPS